jgi:hypothetical protein
MRDVTIAHRDRRKRASAKGCAATFDEDVFHIGEDRHVDDCSHIALLRVLIRKIFFGS